MSVQAAYNEWSQTYDADTNATRDLDQVVTRRVLGELKVESIIEIGCGTGKNTKFFADLGERVQAMDFSAGMLAKAKENFREISNVTFSVADITKRWPCAERSAGLVSCNLVLEHVNELSPVFAEAARALIPGGWFFVCELHPFRQYQGTVANFSRGEQKTQIPAFVHHISEFVKAAQSCGFTVKRLEEWWHEKDEGKPPRLVSFLFEKG
ncbi:class I SAM-dependent DNA methyltransferase [Pedosphaera parvula]|nr:class I SAM-dependent methyltransferase [Pedosphaera parvula]